MSETFPCAGGHGEMPRLTVVWPGWKLSDRGWASNVVRDHDGYGTLSRPNVPNWWAASSRSIEARAGTTVAADPLES